MATLTSRKLKLAGACWDQIELFKELGGDKVTITEALVSKYAERFDWNWAVKNLLGSAARADYERIQDAAWADYRRIRNAALADYKRIQAPASAGYKRILDAARADYERIQAVTFWRLYEKQ